ncbi:uncharacterized protein LOC110685346 [Chenopodium quinoa]|uniref:uncharacterized protein LOC110685346 n=1 Tax=Chenopodium quinoa TaxID=63459 RepID=UPI000B7774C1|nr:uncharacterized protein LOC110685346 [Chenopodium quinoa]
MEKAKDGNPSSSTSMWWRKENLVLQLVVRGRSLIPLWASPRNKRTTTSMLVGSAVRLDIARRTATFSRRKWRNPRMVKLLRARTNPPKDDDSWWMDSGASRHVCKVKHWFKTFHKVGDGEELFMGNNSTIMVQGRGQVELMFSSGNSIILRDVLYAPSISRNLVSGPTLNRLGFRLVFEADRCIITKGSTFVGHCYLSHGLFKLSLRERSVMLDDVCFNVGNDNSMNLHCFLYGILD